MSTPKGYPSQTKLDRVKAEFATVESVREEQQALSVLSHMYVRVVGTDAAEASSTTYVINATAHAALKGDIIRFTSGVHSGKEIKVQSVTTNAITLAYNLAAAVGTGDTFEILRHKYPVVNADGSLNITSSGSGPIQYVLNGVDTEVELDTVTPANSRPLPVEIIGTGAPINITAGDLNVSLSHANDSVKIGDGTETANVNASNELQVADDTARTSLSSIDGKTPSLGQALMAASVPVAIASDQSVISVADGGGSLTVDGTVAATQSGTWNINNVSGTVSLPTGASTLAEQQTQTTHLATVAGAVSGTEMQVDVLTQPARSHTTDSIRLGDGTDLASVTAAGQLEVSVTAALPSGTNNIGDVDVLTEPATAADGGGLPAVTKVVAGYDGSNVQVIKTDANGELQVDVLSQPALSSGTDSVAAVQSGTWNITDISGTVSLPTGASTLAEQQTQTTALQLIDDTVATTGAAITAKGIAAVGTDGTNARILKTDTAGELQVDVLTVPTYDVVDFIDTTPLLDTSSTNIAGSASNPTQVVASLAADVKKVQFLDTTGAFIGLYTGAALSEVLQAVFGPGSDQTVEVKLSSGERVSLRRLDSTTAISTGFVSINFIG